jgi:hypothetical protein
MEQSGTMKGPDVTRVQWAPLSWRTSFKSLIIVAIGKCCIMPALTRSQLLEDPNASPKQKTVKRSRNRGTLPSS